MFHKVDGVWSVHRGGAEEMYVGTPNIDDRITEKMHHALSI